MTIHQLDSQSRVMSSDYRKIGLRLGLASFAVGAILLTASSSQAQIKQPGSHPHYEWDVEPHLVWRYDNDHFGGDGFGPGVRATYIFSDNGPISSINNTMGIGFGFDWAHFDNNACGHWWDNNRNWDGCKGNEYMFPVVVQWNFYFARQLAVFGEPGLMINHHSWSANTCPYGNCSSSDTSVEPVLFVGARLHFNDKVALTGRIIWNYASIGLSFTF
jgi:hypothetical protein